VLCALGWSVRANAQPAAPELQQAAVPAVPAATAPGPLPEAPAAPLARSSLSVGKALGGTFQPSALLQFWVVASRQSVREPADETTFSFRLRRAELKMKGDIIPDTVRYQLMLDAARALEPNAVEVATPGDAGTVKVTGSSGALTILCDFFITFPTDFVDVSVGQYRIPIGYESYNSSSKLLFPERAPIERYYGDRRDIGVRLEKKIGRYLGYYAGIFNGSGQNKLDDDRAKDVALRLEVYPIEGLTLAGVGYTTLGKREGVTRDRVEADLRYEGYGALVLAEHIRGWDRKNQAPAVRGQGTTIQLAYTILDRLQPMARFGDIDPDMDKWGDHYWHYEGGLAWLIQSNEAKITLSVSGYDPTHTDHRTNVAKTEAILSTQASF
jgi:Phosphate-selective porin O and P